MTLTSEVVPVVRLVRKTLKFMEGIGLAVAVGMSARRPRMEASGPVVAVGVGVERLGFGGVTFVLDGVLTVVVVMPGGRLGACVLLVRSVALLT